MNSEEVLLTQTEIEEIESLAAKHPQLRHPHAITFLGKGHKMIQKVTPKNELIFIKGNKDTGFTHIVGRHSYFSEAKDWVEIADNKTGATRKKLQDQSRFPTDTIPFEYMDIADHVFSPENLNNLMNNRGDVFDLYIGDYKHKNGSISKYKLLTYKNSRVVHTIFPQSNKNNRKRVKKFDFARGEVKGTFYGMESVVELIIPYFNHNGVLCYSVLIRIYLAESVEECIIRVHNEKEEVLKSKSIGKRPLPNQFDSVPQEMMRWQHADLRVIEKHIKDLDNSGN